MPEVWLIHPTDRILTIYQLEGSRYGRPTILELKGETAIAAVPDISIDWDSVVNQLELIP